MQLNTSSYKIDGAAQRNVKVTINNGSKVNASTLFFLPDLNKKDIFHSMSTQFGEFYLLYGESHEHLVDSEGR